MSFAGFPPEAADFLRALAANNERAWFQANRGEYERHVKAPLGGLVDALAMAFAVHDIPLTGNGRTSPFRINRDIRFSNDKSPYKTQAGAVLSRDGTRRASGVLYIHITPTDGLMALGFWNPEPPRLQALRQAIVSRHAAWARVTAALDRAGLSLSTDDTLTRLPRGFDGVYPALAATIRLRHLVISQPLTLARMGRPGLVEEVVDFARAGLPLLEFGWAAM